CDRGGGTLHLKRTPGRNAGGALEDDGAAARVIDGVHGGLAKEFADESAERLVGGAVTGVIDVVLQFVEQFVGIGIALVQVAGQGAMKNFVEAVVNARVEFAEVRQRQR